MNGKSRPQQFRLHDRTGHDQTEPHARLLKLYRKDPARVLAAFKRISDELLVYAAVVAAEVAELDEAA